MSEIFKDNEKQKITALVLRVIFENKPLHHDIIKRIKDFSKKYNVVLKKSGNIITLKEAIMQFVENSRGEDYSLNILSLSPPPLTLLLNHLNFFAPNLLLSLVL